MCPPARNGRRLWLANSRRLRQMKRLGISIPTVLAISPTMRCNFNCRGCYSRGRPVEEAARQVAGSGNIALLVSIEGSAAYTDEQRRPGAYAAAQPLMLIQFPKDEYGEDNYCSAAGRASLHINSQGGIEPCPFISIACENIRESGLLTACRSPFLRAIREQERLLRRKRFACALFEHLDEIGGLAAYLKGRASI